MKIDPSSVKTSDVEYLAEAFRSEFAFDANVNVVVTFQRYDPKWDDMVDLDTDSCINNKDKLTAVVTPILVTPPLSSPVETCLEKVSERVIISHIHVYNVCQVFKR